MKYNVDDTWIHEGMELLVQNITEYLMLGGISKDRYYFHSLPLIRVNDETIMLDKTDNIGNILDQLYESRGDIIFNINGQYSEYLHTCMVYHDLGIEDQAPIFDWSQDIKYVIIE